MRVGPSRAAAGACCPAGRAAHAVALLVAIISADAQGFNSAGANCAAVLQQGIYTIMSSSTSSSAAYSMLMYSICKDYESYEYSWVFVPLSGVQVAVNCVNEARTNHEPAPS